MCSSDLESQKAIADYNQAILLNPNYAEAYYNRGVAYDDLGEYQKAITDYNQAIRLNPNDADAYELRGANYVLLEEYQKAIADLQKAETLFQQQGDTARAKKVKELVDELIKLLSK